MAATTTGCQELHAATATGHATAATATTMTACQRGCRRRATSLPYRRYHRCRGPDRARHPPEATGRRHPPRQMTSDAKSRFSKSRGARTIGQTCTVTRMMRVLISLFLSHNLDLCRPFLYEHRKIICGSTFNTF